ncbi:MAG: 4-(cytidine 5'-diphospho)-2-C-methyl-D-erythritol kinase [Clostridia bacterium]|nr:4-(cytidine 5'-diphospho)-2-C-methyl-D-erythritol kinase [Clostridia bacterium]
MEKIYTKARAKVNLCLSILEKRPDNYHNLESVFQKINLYDEMWLEKTNTSNIEIESDIKNVNLEDNIIYKAYQKLKEKFANITGVKVTLNKKIPMQAGLAGGSTDCASFLIAMKKLFELNISNEELEKIGSSLGADVVPCMYNGVVKAEGIGDIITKIYSDFKYYLVIIKPNACGSTKEMYERLDNRQFIKAVRTNQIVESIEEKNIDKLAQNLYNDFEEVSKEFEETEMAKDVLMQNNALNTLLAGSGACVFGIFKNKEDAKKAYKNLQNDYETYITTSYNKKEK